jgi:hypothetical protein
MIGVKKDVIATKVFASGCVVCEHMSRYDRPTFEGFPEVAYQELDLRDIIDHGDNKTKLRLYQLIERHAINNDYTVDTPLYMVMTTKGKYLGHHTGEATIVELRNKIKQILEEDP